MSTFAPWGGPFGQDPRQQQPQGQPQGQPVFQNDFNPNDPMAKMMNSPWMAMANAGARNMSAIQQNQARTDPIKAYQAAILGQATANQNKKAKEQEMANRDLDMQKKRQDLNPFYEYEQAKIGGIIPEEMTFAEFQMVGGRRIDSTSPIKNVREWELQNPPPNGDTQDPEWVARRNKFFNMAVARPQYLDTGGSGIAEVGNTGMRQVVDPTSATGLNAAEAGAKQVAVEGAKTNADLVRGSLREASSGRIALRKAEDLLATTDKWIAKFEEGTDSIDTGFATNLMFDLFGVGTEELGDLKAETIRQAMEGLKLANLAPVTEQEFAAVMQMWANIAKSPKVNIGTLKNAKAKTMRLMEMIQEDGLYNAGIMEEYGTKGQYTGFLRTNKYVADLVNPPEPPKAKTIQNPEG